MPELKNPRHERFCLFYYISGNASEAYRQAGFRFTKNADVTGPRLLGNVGIQRRIAEIKAQNRPPTVKSRDSVLQWLSDLMDRPAIDAPKVSDQVRAAEVIARMAGYNEPDQVQFNTANSLTGYLLELRKEPLGAPVLELMSEPTPEGNGDENKSESP